ncbi:glycosyltransferase involved in cell wall biosynthesis [Dyadobacter jejuensis]|uniref:Glycosyltransferase involved in cell wall biosynthesis n=1 Tax=Dyadobacter jejuensis TaxID=1082580 RepID=A0A316ANN1_9BACT|nr:glycosyltransferase family 2 protein [Dyadobacter jejuensis]PWJ59091.1 glycosyltransferase involved in cell wall biosynthesis [Dyadobacter jejuensis]
MPSIQNPLVSIALCVYNGDRFLEIQLNSLLEQSYPHIEIVAVDDCSTDDSRQILQRYRAQHPERIKVIENETNKGYVKNFEWALRNCTGQFIAFCDQDDIWHPEKISKQVDQMPGHLLVYHDSQFIQEDGTTMDKKMSDVINMVVGADPAKLLLFNSVSGHSCLIDRQLLQYILPFDPDHFHDHWTAYVALNVGKVAYIRETLVQYRQHQSSSTDILNRRKKLDKSYHENRDVKKLTRELNWLKKCQSFSQNKDQAFLDTFVNLFETRLDTYFSFQYAQFIGKHFDRLFYIQKKRKSSRSGYIYRQIWGLRAKTLWAKFFK